jgi:Serine/threonine protein kinase
VVHLSTLIAEYGYIALHELRVVGTLGVGGFGRVELVQYKRDKNLTFALKCLKKAYVVEQKQEEHTFNEKRVMQACSDSPFISK